LENSAFGWPASQKFLGLIPQEGELRMKKFIAIAALLALGFSVIAFKTDAFFTASGTACNVITSGSTQIEIKETDTHGNPYPTEPIAIMPGMSVGKNVTVRNTGTGAAWVRVAMETTAASTKALDTRNVLLQTDTQHWTEQDGYYYYNTALAAGQETEPLLTRVAFSGEMGNDYQGANVRISITGYAVQSANNGASVFEAAGWPKG
jgi:hypothetical protein